MTTNGPAPTPSDAESFLVRHRVLALLMLGLLLYVPFLGMRDLWYPDEPDIAQVCKAMYESGDWISPRRMGEIWVDYPPMLYWAGTVSAHALGGMSDFSLRLPNALAAIAVVLMTCAAGSRWFDPRTGLWAGFMLLTFQQFAYQAVSYRPDVLFTVFIAAGMIVYATGAGAGGRPRFVWRVAGFALLGLAMLSKGPLGLLLPGLVLTLWHGSRREWRRIVELAPLSLVSLAVYLPWFVACAHAMGSDSILHELYAQNFQRFLSGSRGHGQPWFYYLTAIWVDLAPWSVLLLFAVVWIARSRLRRDPRVQLALWWLGVFIVFLSIAVTKRQLYLLPAYPAAALLLAPWVAAVTSPRRVDLAEAPSPRPARLYAVAVAGLLALLGIVLVVVALWPAFVVARAHLTELELDTVPALRAPLGVAGIVLIAGGAWIVAAWRRRDTLQALVRLGLTHVALYVVLLAWLLPAMNPFRSYRPQCEWLRVEMGPTNDLGLVNPWRGPGKRGAFGYYTGAMVELLESGEDVDRFFDRHPDCLVLVLADAAPAVFGERTDWRAGLVRELLVTRDVYLVLRAYPRPAAPSDDTSTPAAPMDD